MQTPLRRAFLAMLAIEELARVDASAAIYVDVHNTLVNNAILKWGTDEQKARLFPRMTTGLLGAYALSEPASGSDAFALQCKAERVGDHWELTGRKFWITNGAEAGIFIVFANTDFAKGYKGITAFLVERDFPGFAVGKKENKLGIRASSTCELILENCQVQAGNGGKSRQNFLIVDFPTSHCFVEARFDFHSITHRALGKDRASGYADERSTPTS